MLLLNEKGIEGLLKECGVDVVYTTSQDFVCLCPFHHNRRTPSLTVSRMDGVYNCFNPSCGARGNMVSMVAFCQQMPKSDAYRLVQAKEMSLEDIVARVEYDINKTDDLFVFDQDIVDRCKADFPGSPGEDYLVGRGFTKETLAYFDVGFSKKQSAVMVPVHSYQGILMGVIGRSIAGKRFINSNNLQGRRTLFNVHRAKRHGDTLIIVEASFDAMKVHQAGFPNVAALFKGTLTSEQAAVVKRTFNKVIIFVDNDDPSAYQNGLAPGAALAKTINNLLKDSMLVYKVPFEAYHGLKDATDMNEDQISASLNSAEMLLDLGL